MHRNLKVVKNTCVFTFNWYPGILFTKQYVVECRHKRKLYHFVVVSIHSLFGLVLALNVERNLIYNAAIFSMYVRLFRQYSLIAYLSLKFRIKKNILTIFDIFKSQIIFASNFIETRFSWLSFALI